jgi:hypothetical protein
MIRREHAMKAREKAMLAREKAMLAKKKALVELKAREAAQRPAVPAPAGVTGKVLAIRPQVGLVMISRGSDDGVQKGAVFAINRAGTRIGKVTVEKVFANMSSARILRPPTGPPIREGDDAVPDVPIWGEEDDVF